MLDRRDLITGTSVLAFFSGLNEEAQSLDNSTSKGRVLLGGTQETASDFPYPTFPFTTIAPFEKVSDVLNTTSLPGTLSDAAMVDSPYGATALKVTFNGSNGIIQSKTLRSPVDCSGAGGSIRITFKPINAINSGGALSRFGVLLLDGSGNNAQATFQLFLQQMSTSAGGIPGRFQTISIPLSAFIHNGTVNLAGINQVYLADNTGILRATSGSSMALGHVDFVPNPRSKAAVIVRFDDGKVSSYNTAKPLLDAVGAPAFLAISPVATTINVNPSFFLTTAQVTAQLAAGWQFGCQTYSTEDFTTWTNWTLAQQLADFASDRAAARSFGHFRDSIDGTYFSNVSYTTQGVYPAFKQSFRTVQNFLGALPSGAPLYFSECFPFGDPLNVISLGLATIATPSWTQLWAALDQTRAAKGVLILTIHDDLLTPDYLTSFNNMIRYVTSTWPSQIEFTTMRRLLAPYNGDTLTG
jgi:hypothetical protein